MKLPVLAAVILNDVGSILVHTSVQTAAGKIPSRAMPDLPVGPER